MNVTIKWHKFSSNIYYIYVFFVIWSWKLRQQFQLQMTKNRTPTLVYLDSGMHSGLEVKGLTAIVLTHKLYAVCCWIVWFYFSLFEAGIADANSSFKWRIITIFMKKWTSPILNYWINWAPRKNDFYQIQWYVFWYKTPSKRIYITTLFLIT